MTDVVRRLLAGAMLALAVVGFMPLLPLVFGFQSGNVASLGSGTTAPPTTGDPAASPAFFYCQQDVGSATTTAINLSQKNKTYTSKYWWRCTNKWTSSVNITMTIANAGVTGISLANGTVTGTIQSGQSECIQAVLNSAATGQNGTVVYQVAFTGTGVKGTVQFAGDITYPGGDTTSSCASTLKAN